MILFDPSQRLRETTRLLIRKLGVLERGEALCCGITLTQCHAIVETGRKEQMSVNELAELLNLDKSTVSRTVDQLVNNNIMIREADQNDRRYVTLKLTSEGDQLFKNIEQRMERYFTEILDSIALEKREQVIESLQIFTDKLKSISYCGTSTCDNSVTEKLDKVNQIEGVSGDVDYRIRTAVDADLPVIDKLLEVNELTTVGIQENLKNFLVADHKGVIGVIGLEFAEHGVMLRSMAVRQELRNRDIGTALMERSLAIARQAGIKEAYLLTNTAEKFAARWGFYKIQRSEIPAKLMQSSTLNTFCPSSSVSMKLVL